MNLLGFLIMLQFYLTPIVITVFNIINLLKKKPLVEGIIDSLTFILGIILSLLLFIVWDAPEYTEPIVLDGTGIEFHTPVSYEHMATVVLLAVIALLGYFYLRTKKNMLSPIISVICISAMYIGIVLSTVFIIQLSNNIMSYKGSTYFDILYMTLFPLNYILCSVRLIKQVINHHIEYQKINEITYQNKILQFCQQLLSESIGWYVSAFILMIPLLYVLIAILVLFGQKPDAVIRAFTETSDWTFSHKLSPPPVEYEGHYLCTVAVNGHNNIVKPTRAGIRHGVKITVNRQLCIANAFEQLIEEKVPKIHRLVRSIYDKYGYPISKHITTPYRADIVYIAMKPLEWLFLIVIYLFDVNPENRIDIQYTGKLKTDF